MLKYKVLIEVPVEGDTLIAVFAPPGVDRAPWRVRFGNWNGNAELLGQMAKHACAVAERGWADEDAGIGG